MSGPVILRWRALIPRLCLVACVSMTAFAWGQSTLDDAGTDLDAGRPDAGVPVACDGALCDTTNGSGCNSTGNSIYFGTFLAGACALKILYRKRRSGSPGMTKGRT